MLTITVLDDDGCVLYAVSKSGDFDPIWLVGLKHDDQLLCLLDNRVIEEFNS